MKLLLSKTDEATKVIENVLQVDMSNLGALDNTPDWNFVTILYTENGEKKKIGFKLSEIMQFSVIN